MAEKQCNLLKNGGDMSERQMVFNRNVSVSAGANSNVALTIPFNKNTKWVVIELAASGTVLSTLTLPIERFKQINTVADTRVTYWDGQAAYNVGLYYVNDSTVHITAYMMPITLSVYIRSLEEQ